MGGIVEVQPFREPPPSRHRGSRTVAKPPDLIRSIAAVRGDVETSKSRLRRQDMAFSAVNSGVPCTTVDFTPTHDVLAYRFGHALYLDAAFATGTGSVVEARLNVPALGAIGDVVTSPAGGTEQVMRVTLLDLPDTWLMGDPQRVYLEARRASGTDTTTVRVLAAWQR